jgi:hypothetical protein
MPRTRRNTPASSRAAERKILQRRACDFVDYVHYTRIAAYLPEARKRHHRREDECNEQIYAVFTLFVSVLLVHASRVLIVPEPCEFRMPEMI